MVYPITDIVDRVSMTGKLFVQALENGVSAYPKYEGRFPSVSGIHFKFDPKLPPGKRILMDSITDINGKPFDLEKEYVVATKRFLRSGKDGYVCLLDDSIKLLKPVQGEESPSIQHIFIQHLRNFTKDKWHIVSKQGTKFYDIFQERMRVLNTSFDDRSEKLNAIKIRP